MVAVPIAARKSEKQPTDPIRAQLWVSVYAATIRRCAHQSYTVSDKAKDIANRAVEDYDAFVKGGDE